MALLTPITRFPRAALPPLRHALVGRSPLDRPSTRGIAHQYAFLLSVLAAVALGWAAGTAAQLLGIVAYCGTVSLMLGTSAMYHRINWPVQWVRHVRRADHCMIYLSMAGCYLGLWEIVLPHDAATDIVLGLVGPLALLGIAFKVAWLDAPRWLHSTSYLLLSFSALVTIPALFTGAGTEAATIFLAGCACHLLGVAIYTAGWPDPSPQHFGHHEIFHVLVVLGLAGQYVVLALTLT